MIFGNKPFEIIATFEYSIRYTPPIKINSITDPDGFPVGTAVILNVLLQSNCDFTWKSNNLYNLLGVFWKKEPDIQFAFELDALFINSNRME